MTSDDIPHSRRRVLKELTTGLMLASAAPVAFGQRSDLPPGDTVVLQNPATEYPKPPFPAQQQEWPGLVSKMTPRPDHGETSYKGSGRLTGRKALLTGGDSGMGRAAAIAFAREGADVAINYLPQEESDAKDVIALIRGAGRKAVALPGDLREEAFCNRLISDAVSQLGGLDILVSNAARQVAQKSILDISTEQFDATFKTNVYAMFWLTKAAIPHMKPGSSIICTTSINAYSPEPYILDYAATKGAIAIYVKALAKQMAKQGIRVNGVAPGPIWTPLQPSGGQLPDKLPTFGADTPMGRAGQPAELAPIYVLLAENRATYVTGQIIGATGGLGGA
jgi:NAD(P)-dependent dehydrogenase (short-subunit alcohol dehydrogenase family)